MNADEMGRSLTLLKSILTTWAPKEIDRELCVVWVLVLKDFTDQQIRDAFVKAVSDLTEWPTPATVKRLILGSNKTDAEIGQEISSRIEGAISRIGSFRYESLPAKIKAREAELRAIVGDMGMEVIRLAGGWSNICDTETDQMPSARKQWRELGAIVSKNLFTTGSNLPPALPKAQNNPLLADAIKLAIESK